MESVLLLDTSIATANNGDKIIMECVEEELSFITQNRFIYSLPTHVSSFHWYQVLRNSYAIQRYANCEFKFAGGSNMLVKDMLTHYPQWNINWFNCKPLIGLVLVGVGAGAGDKSNFYTRKLYRKVLSHDFFHSVRDERSKEYVESLGLKAINTGCVTMWKLTPDFCKKIPSQKSNTVVFTLTATSNITSYERDQYMIDVLLRQYDCVFFWPQGDKDLKYLQSFKHIDDINVLQANKKAFDDYLTQTDTDYIGTRLHGGIYAMRHARRAIIISIDERAREINKKNNLNCIDTERIIELEDKISSTFPTEIKMDYDKINNWRNQFIK